MAVFRPITNTCELNFDDKFIYNLPLHDETINKIVSVCDDALKKLKSIKATDKAALNEAYNTSLDALDEILGDGAGADIMSIYDNPGLFDVAPVVEYIANTYKEEYKKIFGEQKAKYTPTERRGRK